MGEVVLSQSAEPKDLALDAKVTLRQPKHLSTSHHLKDRADGKAPTHSPADQPEGKEPNTPAALAGHESRDCGDFTHGPAAKPGNHEHGPGDVRPGRDGDFEDAGLVANDRTPRGGLNLHVVR